MNSETKSADLRKRINERIREISDVADLLPGVVIIHNVTDFSVEYMSPAGVDMLGVTLEEIKTMGNQGQDYHNRFFNPDDAKDYLPKIIGLVQQQDEHRVISFFQQVRASADNDWSWYFSSLKILMKDEAGKPLLTITIACPIDPKHHITAKVSRLLEEKNFLRNNLEKFAQLTKRELEIFKLIVMGKTSLEISDSLHISLSTAETHRKNIKRKLNISTSFDLSLYARAFDLI
jgi:DNA-binding CsgD family transcriptional regulator